MIERDADVVGLSTSISTNRVECMKFKGIWMKVKRFKSLTEKEIENTLQKRLDKILEMPI